MPKTYVTNGDKLDSDPYNRLESAPAHEGQQQRGVAPPPPQTAVREGWWARKSRRARLAILAVLVLLVALGIALGVGLGIGLRDHSGSGGGNGGNSGNPDTTDKPIPSTPANNTLIWRPEVRKDWQIILQNPLSLPANATSVDPNDVGIWDIDLFNNPQEVIDTLHRLGKKVICYFSAGSYEPGRPDSGEFTDADKGSGLKGWPGEKWLNLTSPNVRRIMKARIEMASQKQCDAVDPDNVDGYANSNGLGLTMKDSIDFMAYLSGVAASLNLAIGLKNAGQIVQQILPGVQFAVNEQCVQYDECTTWSAFINASKPVFHIEYTGQVKDSVTAQFCKDTGMAQGANGFSTVIKHMNLDGWVEYCNGQQATTPTNTTGS